MSTLRLVQEMSRSRLKPIGREAWNMCHHMTWRSQNRIACHGVKTLHGNNATSPTLPLYQHDKKLHSPQYVKTQSMSAVPSAWFQDYEKGIEEFKMEVPERFNFSRDVIDKWAEVQMQVR